MSEASLLPAALDRSRIDALCERTVPPWARPALQKILDDAFSGRDVELVVRHHPELPAEIAGFACVTPATLARDAYVIRWIVCDEALDAGNTAAELLQSVERVVTERRGRLIRFDGASFRCVGVPSAVFDGAGYERVGSIPDFYGVDHDLVIFVRRIAQLLVNVFNPAEPAHLYDAAFAYRDFRSERDFFLACARKWGTRSVKRVASWSSGAARHLREFARLGIEGLAIEESDGLLELARETSRGVSWLEPRLRLHRGSLTEVPDAPRVDLSFCALSAVHRLQGPDGIRAHLEAAAALLAPGGLHIIEASHPKDVRPGGATMTTWTDIYEGYRVQSRFQTLIDRVRPDGTIPAVLDVACRDEHGTAVSGGSLHVEESWYVPDIDEWARIVDDSRAFETVATLGDFNIEVPCDQPGAWRVMTVLRKREPGK